VKLKEAILRKTAKTDSQALANAAAVAGVKPATGHMDPIARKLYIQKKTMLLRKDLNPQQRVNLQKGVQQYEAELNRLQNSNLTYKQVDEKSAEKHTAQNAGAKAKVLAKQKALSEGKDEGQAEAIGDAAAAIAAEQVVSRNVRGTGDWDAAWNGGGRAEVDANFGKYMSTAPAGITTSSQIDPKTRQRLLELSPEYQKAQKGVNRVGWADAALNAVTMGNYGNARRIAGAYEGGGPTPGVQGHAQAALNRTIPGKVEAKAQQADKQYATEIKKAPEMYRNARNSKITGFLKNNWGTLAGLGMGAIGLMALGRNNRAAAQTAAPATTRPQTNWAANKNFGHDSYRQAGNMAQTSLKKPGGMFNSFMSGVPR